MIYRLRVLWALLTGGLPPRCSGCGRYIVGLAVSVGADGGQRVHRCYPGCPRTFTHQVNDSGTKPPQTPTAPP